VTQHRSGHTEQAFRLDPPEGHSRRPPDRSLARRLSYVAFNTLNRLVPKQRKVVLHSMIDVEDGVLALLEELSERQIPATVLLEDPAHAVALRAVAPEGVKAVAKRSLTGVLCFLTAEFVVTTMHVFGDRRPPANQVQINIWHGEPPTKIVARFFPDTGGIACTYAPVCSTMGRAYRAAEFDLAPQQVPILGAPRNDRMLRADAAAIRAEVTGEERDLPTLLWLPTHRAGRWGDRERRDTASDTPAGLPFTSEELDVLDEWLVKQGARLVLKLHPNAAVRWEGSHRAITVLDENYLKSRGLTLYPLLAAFDGLITDVSSVWVDYLLLDKPMIFAVPDIEDYRRGRGLNLEPYEDWVPGPFVRTMAELVGALAEVVGGGDPTADERRLARRRFHRYADDQSAVRLLDGLGLTAQR